MAGFSCLFPIVHCNCCSIKAFICIFSLIVQCQSAHTNGGKDDTVPLSGNNFDGGRRLRALRRSPSLLLRRPAPRHFSCSEVPFLSPQRARYSPLRRLFLRHTTCAGATRQASDGGRAGVASPQKRVDDSTPRKESALSTAKQLIPTLQRATVPTIFAVLIGYLFFDDLVFFLRGNLDDSTIKLLKTDPSQFIQNCHNTNSAIFQFLAGAAYVAFYNQQQQIYLHLFEEISEAKALLEQITLVLQGRRFYKATLSCIREYVKNDLRQLSSSPAKRLTMRREDPLESVMYMTSVGAPSLVYETVKELREKRSKRLGAMQRKFPALGIALLYVLAVNSLWSFPMLAVGAESRADASAGVLALQSYLFAFECGVHMLVLQTIQELWRSSGGAYTVDGALDQMVSGLEQEVERRSTQADRFQTVTSPNSRDDEISRGPLWSKGADVVQGG